jgi:hypothetical protein
MVCVVGECRQAAVVMCVSVVEPCGNTDSNFFWF